MTLDALDVLAALVLEDGRRWGEAAAPFQWEDARAVLTPQSPTPYHYLTRARGSSKTTDLAGISVAALLTQLPPGSRSYALAADRDQGALLVDAVRGFLQRTPFLAGRIEVSPYKVLHLGNGATLEVLAADAPGAWGLRPAFVVVDELAQWASTAGPLKLWEAVSSAVAKVPDARLVVLTTAGDPAHWSYKVLDHALADALWRVREVHGPAPWMDARRLDEQRRRLPESSFHRLFLNEWTAAEDRLTNRDDLLACVTLSGPLEPVAGLRYVCGLDVGLKHDRTVASVCHLERRDGVPRVVLDRQQVWAGTRANPVRLSTVAEWLVFSCRRYKARLVVDPWQAMDLAQRVRTRGLLVEEFAFSPASVGRLASSLHLLLRDRALALPDDEELLDELANVRLRESSPGVFRMDHDPGKHDDRAISLALAAQKLLDAAPTVDPARVVAQFASLNAGMTGQAWTEGFG